MCYYSRYPPSGHACTMDDPGFVVRVHVCSKCGGIFKKPLYARFFIQGRLRQLLFSPSAFIDTHPKSVVRRGACLFVQELSLRQAGSRYLLILTRTPTQREDYPTRILLLHETVFYQRACILEACLSVRI
jgi:hypothetical protein